MTTARLISGRPLVEFTDDGYRLLVRDLVVDLGVEELELEEWDWQLRPLAQRVGPSITGKTQVRVAAGMVYDGASIPPFSQYLMGAKECWEVAGVVHDALYQWQAPRPAADRVFWIIARSEPVRAGPVRGWLGWAVLRTFGWFAYRARRVGGEAQKAVVAVAQEMKDAVTP